MNSNYTSLESDDFTHGLDGAVPATRSVTDAEIKFSKWPDVVWSPVTEDFYVCLTSTRANPS